jgi:hypothetical protein
MPEPIIMKLSMHVMAPEDISMEYFVNPFFCIQRARLPYETCYPNVRKSERNEHGYIMNTKDTGCSGR